MTTKIDIRQAVSRDSLGRITGTSGSQLDDITRALNTEITPVFALSVTGANRVVTVGAGTLANPDTGTSKAILSNGGTITSFASGTVTLGATGVDNATPSAGSALGLGMTASQFMYVGISITSAGNIALVKGAAGASQGAATIPARVSGNYPVGYFLVQTNGSNNVQNIVSSVLWQYSSFQPDAVSLTGSEVVTNKDIDGGTASNTSRITMPKASTSTLTALTRKQGTVVYDTTVNSLLVDDGTNLNAIGGGAGELNLIAAGASTAVGWTAATGATLATTTTAGDLPLGTMVATAIKITSGTGASSEATVATTNSYSFTTPASYAVKTKVELWMRPGTNFINSEWTVSVYAGSTRQALTTDASSITYLPNANGKFTTYFDAVASTAYTVRLTRTVNAGVNAAVLNIANVIVGPGIQPQGAVVGPWVSYTPIYGNISTTGATGIYRRVGDSMEIVTEANPSNVATGTITVPLPSGYTINTTAITSTGTAGTLGTAIGRPINGATAAVYVGFVQYSSPTTVQIFGNDNSTSPGAGNTWDATHPATWAASGEILTLRFTVPIAEWAGSGTVNLAQNDVEYASNSSTADADDTTSFSYGPAGNTLPGTLTGVKSKRVRFQAPIQAGDAVVVEVAENVDGPWLDAKSENVLGGSILIDTYDSIANVGFGQIRRVSATDVDVVFRRYRNGTSDWATTSGFWRVRKSVSGQAVGFGIVVPGTSSGLVSASGLPGNTTGNAIASGYVGEKIAGSATTRASALAATSLSTYNISSIVLTPGRWRVSGFISNKQTMQNLTSVNHSWSTVSATIQGVVGDGNNVFYERTSVDSNDRERSFPAPDLIIDVSVTATHYLVFSPTATATTNWYGTAYAIRIA